jgi:site-specific DNA recombinase
MADGKNRKRASSTRKKRETVPLAEGKQLVAEQEIAKRKAEEPELFRLPESKKNVQDLVEYFVKVEEGTNRILPKERRRYVIYLRKSTDDEQKQVRSLPDQLTECLEVANYLGVTVRDEDIFEESESAKLSGKRPIFDDMLIGFKTGKYHGLISWSPDRLSRNMKEAGEIIEMIDLEQIQDLHFKTYQFENNPNGKMMLGILFATSKQYSDKLSVDVKRGNTGNIREGKYNGVVKKGYFVDASTGYFMPDGFNWDLLREAVSMRLYKGKTQIEIAEFLNEAGFSSRKTQDDKLQVVRVDKQMVGDLFADPFYFGLYRYGQNLADLTEIYDFLPLMTVDEYITLNQGIAGSFGATHAGKSVQNSRLDYGLLRGKVICDFCDEVMGFQNQEIKRGKNKDKWVISFYCRNKACIRHNSEEATKQFGHPLSKSIRAKYISAHIEYTLRSCTKKSKEAYRFYIDRLESKLAQDRAITSRKLSEAKNDLRINEKQYARYQQFQIEHPEEYEKHHKNKLEHYEHLVGGAKHSIKVCTEELEQLKTGLPTEQEFYELISSYLKTLLNTTDLMEQDAIYNEVVLNLRAGDDVVSVIKLNPPYSLLVDLAKISAGRGERTRTFDLAVPNRAR